MTADLLATLTAERYGPSLWWTTRATEQPADTEHTCATRRRQLASDRPVRRKGA